MTKKAVTIREKLVKNYQSVPLYRRHLAVSLKRLALARQKSDKIAAATADCRRALELFGALTTRPPDLLVEMAGCQALLSVLAGKRGAGVSPKEGVDATAEALRLLHQAIAAGYANRDGLASDGSLDPLRQREDFKKLLAELEAKTKKP